MQKQSKKELLKGGVIIEGEHLDIRIPMKVIEIFKGQPRLIFKKAEWYGIHPVPIDMLSPELKNIAKDHMIIAVPNEMMK